MTFEPDAGKPISPIQIRQPHQPEQRHENLCKDGRSRRILVAVVATATRTKGRSADRAVREGHAVTTDLGANAAAITYWASRSDGWHVVPPSTP